ICDTKLPIFINLRTNRIYSRRKVHKVGVVNRHDDGDKRMSRQRPQIPAKNDAVACADSIELLHPSGVRMIACHWFLEAVGADETKTSTVFTLLGKLTDRVAHELSDRRHSFHVVDCQ